MSVALCAKCSRVGDASESGQPCSTECDGVLSAVDDLTPLQVAQMFMVMAAEIEGLRTRLTAIERALIRMVRR